MDQEERRRFLIRRLLDEETEYSAVEIPQTAEAQKRLLRALLNVRPPRAIGEDFLRVQDAYLRQALAEKGITDCRTLTPASGGVCLWQGDITTLKCDAIVNAANSGMLGCFCPNHGCIDNAIHTYAGVQLRLACAELMKRQGHEEPVGQAKITPAYNLPCEYVLHTVGPIVSGRLTRKEERQLAACYRACLELAADHDLKSVAFCCISTGEFHFPNRRAAEIAIRTVKAFRAETDGRMEVIFNVFKDADWQIYRELLAGA